MCLSTAMSVVLLVSTVVYMGGWPRGRLSGPLITLIDRAAWEMNNTVPVVFLSPLGRSCVRTVTMSVY